MDIHIAFVNLLKSTFVFKFKEWFKENL
jgi:hypothetical protein